MRVLGSTRPIENDHDSRNTARRAAPARPDQPFRAWMIHALEHM
jgi:hypothetical protein